MVTGSWDAPCAVPSHSHTVKGQDCTDQRPELSLSGRL